MKRNRWASKSCRPTCANPFRNSPSKTTPSDSGFWRSKTSARARWNRLSQRAKPAQRSIRSIKIREDEQSGQDSLFEIKDIVKSKPVQAPPNGNGHAESVLARFGWSEHELLAGEKEVLGFYLSGHPLARYQGEINLFSTHR